MEQGNGELMSSPAQEGPRRRHGDIASVRRHPRAVRRAREFLTSLIDAMRRVVEASRDRQALR